MVFWWVSSRSLFPLGFHNSDALCVRALVKLVLIKFVIDGISTSFYSSFLNFLFNILTHCQITRQILFSKALSLRSVILIVGNASHPYVCMAFIIDIYNLILIFLKKVFDLRNVESTKDVLSAFAINWGNGIHLLFENLIFCISISTQYFHSFDFLRIYFQP